MCCLIYLEGCWKMIVPGPPETQVANNVVGFLTSTLRSIPSLSESTTNGAGSSFLRLLMLRVWQRFSSKLKVIPTHWAFGTLFSRVTVLTTTWYLFPWSVDSSSFWSMSVNTRPMFIPFSFVTAYSLLTIWAHKFLNLTCTLPFTRKG